MNFFPPIDQSARATAVISGVYRYKLTRTWGEGRARAIFVMLNPSTADAETDDPTIRKCIGFGQRWGVDGIIVYNLFAYRVTTPQLLLNVHDPIGPENDKFLTEALDRHLDTGACIVCAWGTRGNLYGREQAFIKNARYKDAKLHALGKTHRGFPRHPLYAPYKSKLIPFG